MVAAADSRTVCKGLEEDCEEKEIRERAEESEGSRCVVNRSHSMLSAVSEARRVWVSRAP